MSSRRSKLLASERSRLDPFVVASGDASPRDQRDLMERPFFSLAKAKRIVPILYEAGDVRVEVFAVPEHGMATIWDADILIWAASQIVEAENAGVRTSRFLRFTPYQLLSAIGRETGSRDYKLLKGALTRLQATVIRTTIRNSENWRRHQFSWINEWEECATRDGRIEGMEFVLPDWFYRGVTDRTLVLTIDPAYFRLTGGIERWLYRVARKHAGRQAAGWSFEIPHLHQKSGSQARIPDFALDIRRIAARQPLPGYRLDIEREGRRELLRIRPLKLSADSVDRNVDGLGTSGATDIGTSGAALSGLRAQNTQLTLWPETLIPDLNLESNLESNFDVAPGNRGKPCRGARFREPGRGFADPLRETRTGFTNPEPNTAQNPSVSKPVHSINDDQVAQNLRSNQYANPDHHEPDSQTWNQSLSANPLERQDSAAGSIHETWKNDKPPSSGEVLRNGAGFREPELPQPAGKRGARS